MLTNSSEIFSARKSFLAYSSMLTGVIFHSAQSPIIHLNAALIGVLLVTSCILVITRVKVDPHTAVGLGAARIIAGQK
jgi:hypothetical protein